MILFPVSYNENSVGPIFNMINAVISHDSHSRIYMQFRRRLIRDLDMTEFRRFAFKDFDCLFVSNIS